MHKRTVKLTAGIPFIIAGVGLWNEYCNHMLTEMYLGEFSQGGVLSQVFLWRTIPSVLWVGLILIWIIRDKPKREMSQIEKDRGTSEPYL